MQRLTETAAGALSAVDLSCTLAIFKPQKPPVEYGGRRKVPPENGKHVRPPWCDRRGTSPKRENTTRQPENTNKRSGKPSQEPRQAPKHGRIATRAWRKAQHHPQTEPEQRQERHGGAPIASWNPTWTCFPFSMVLGGGTFRRPPYFTGDFGGRQKFPLFTPPIEPRA